MASAFGGPAHGTETTARQDFTEPQRARWVALATQAADEAKLPADPEFRAALASYLDWSSRTPAGAPLPAWDWSPAGPPSETPAETIPAEEEVPCPDRTRR
jgi:hemoglobin